MSDEAGLYRRLPSVDAVLEMEEVAAWRERAGYGREFARRAVAACLDLLRAGIGAGDIDEAELGRRLEDVAAGVAAAGARLSRFRLRRVINATGVVVHTNLGRSPWSDAAARRVADLSRRYLNLEYDLEEGDRGHRDRPVEDLLARLIPGTAAAVVNNNAAAVLLALNTLAEGREVLVSRGQLVEIGGSFRIPEVMEKGGVRLREVGTTNRTRIGDFERALGPDTALLLAVHPSNYRVVGFTESVPIEQLVELGRRHDVPVMEDMGSGNLLDLGPLGISGEPTVAARLEAGVDLLTFSGDKLLGGPQAGFLVGAPELVGRIRDNPLYRALRLDKAIYLALEATLGLYLTGREDRIPTVGMLRRSPEDLQRAAERLADSLRQRLQALAGRGGTALRGEGSAAADESAAAGRAGSVGIEVVEVASRVGGGSAPGTDLPSWAVSVDVASGPDSLAVRLRAGDPPVIARIADDRLLLDLRTVRDDEVDQLGEALLVALARPGPTGSPSATRPTYSLQEPDVE